MTGPAAALASLAVAPLAAGHLSPTPFIVLMVGGFAIGCFGHLIRSRLVIATGIVLCFLGSVLLPVIAQLA